MCMIIRFIVFIFADVVHGSSELQLIEGDRPWSAETASEGEFLQRPVEVAVNGAHSSKYEKIDGER